VGEDLVQHQHRGADHAGVAVLVRRSLVTLGTPSIGTMLPLKLSSLQIHSIACRA
jgi:hypothetical protein